MKKHLLLVILGACFCIGTAVVVSACSQERKEQAKELTLQEEFGILKNALAEYNGSITSTYPATRAGWPVVAGADAAGATIGGIFGGFWGGLGLGLFSSLFAVFAGEDGADDFADSFGSGSGDTKLTYYFDKSGFVLVNYEDENDPMGQLHNDIIISLYNKYPNLMSMPVGEFITTVKSEIILWGGENATLIVNSAEFNDAVQGIAVKSNHSVSGTLRELFPDYAEELDMVEAYCQTLSVIPTIKAAIEYAEGYVEIVKDSGVSEETKTMLASGAETGLYSSVLWEIKNE